MPNKKTLTIVSPVYNEADVIELFYGVLKNKLVKLENYEWRIVFAVDKCRDNTLHILREIVLHDARVTVLGLSSRFGLQMSILAGIDQVTSDIVVVMDSDLQHPPELISALIQKYEAGYDIVTTTRRDTQGIGLLKKITSGLYYRLFNLLSDIKLDDGSADFFLLSRPVIVLLQNKIRERNLFIRGMLKWIGFKSISVEYTADERKAGHTKFSPVRLIKFGLLGVISFSKKPLRIATFFGFIMALIGILYALYIAILYTVSSSPVPGFATVIVSLLIFNGVQLIVLGIIGEYIGGIFDEVKHRPHYIIEEKIGA